jgi:hypothetical protein
MSSVEMAGVGTIVGTVIAKPWETEVIVITGVRFWEKFTICLQFLYRLARTWLNADRYLALRGRFHTWLLSIDVLGLHFWLGHRSV